jgi:predicted transcriptional regulator
MPKRRAKRLRRDLPPDEKERWQRAAAETESEKAEILAEGRRIKATHNRLKLAVRDALKFLKAQRQAQGLSLSDVQQRTGISRPALSRLENETEPNPTMVTLIRYAEALGKKLVVKFE